MSGSEGQQAVAQYLASKGLPMTGENIRRALEQNASNPGLIKGLVNQAPPPSDSQATPNRSGGSARPTQRSQPQTKQQQPLPVPPIPPPQQQPVAQDSASGGGNMLSQLAQAILGGGAGVGLMHLLGGRGGSEAPIGELGIPYPQQATGQLPSPAPQIGEQRQIGAPSPSPSPVGGPAEIGGPAKLSQLSGPQSPVAGVNPIGPPQPLPSEPIAMPRNTGQSMVMQGAPVSTAMTGGGRVASPVELPHGIDWGKILGELGHVVRR